MVEAASVTASTRSRASKGRTRTASASASRPKRPSASSSTITTMPAHPSDGSGRERTPHQVGRRSDATGVERHDHGRDALLEEDARRTWWAHRRDLESGGFQDSCQRALRRVAVVDDPDPRPSRKPGARPARAGLGSPPQGFSTRARRSPGPRARAWRGRRPSRPPLRLPGTSRRRRSSCSRTDRPSRSGWRRSRAVPGSARR